MDEGDGTRRLAPFVEDNLGRSLEMTKPIDAAPDDYDYDAEVAEAEEADARAAKERALTSLVAAARSGRPENIGLLLGAGADPFENSMGMTALHWAAICQTEGLGIRLLLDAGCDPNEMDSFGNTALHFAVRRSIDHGMAITEALLKGGADPLAVNREGKTPSRQEWPMDPRVSELLAAAEQRAEMLVDDGVKDGTASEPEGGRKGRWGRGL
jgi:ankyrin repeat protein